jgi:hypothetical protein
MRIKIRCRSPLPTPWKWELFDDATTRLVTASALSYGTQREAFAAGEVELAKIIARVGR